MSPPVYDQKDQRVDRQYNAAGNIYNTTVANDDLQDLVGGGWAAGTVLVLGMIVLLAGFAIWMSIIFSAGDYNSSQALFQTRGPIGFGLFIAGGIIAGIGRVIARAHRQRSR